MKICVIGTGYVGLVSGTCFAEAGNEVICVDVDLEKVSRLQRGEIPIYEPGLEAMVRENHEDGRLEFTTDLASAVNKADICFIAVGTPPNEDGSADLSHVLHVATQIAQVARKEVVVGTKSTVPVGTGDKIEALLAEKMTFKSTVFSNPEFLKEGDAITDFMKPDRVVIGLNDNSAEPLLRELYAPFMRQSERLIFMTRRSAELTKYAANAMLATRISFINEMANLCEAVGANISDIRRGIGTDERIGPAFLYPGMGYGGSCFPKDVKALLKTASEHNVNVRMVSACEEANEFQKNVVFEKILRHFGGRQNIKGLKIALWGLAFKARTDDIRESPALSIIDKLLEAEACLSAYDPEAMDHIRKIYGTKISLEKNAFDCLDKADALVIATEWNEFRSPDLRRMKQLMKQPVIFDGRNLLNRKALKAMDFVHHGIGVYG